MYLTDEFVYWVIKAVIIWPIAVLFCIGLLGFGRLRETPILKWAAWINIIWFLGYWATFPIADWQNSRVREAAMRPHPPVEWPGGGLYVPVPRDFFSYCAREDEPECQLDIARLLYSGRFDFVETGTDPVRRWTIGTPDPTCLTGQRPYTQIIHPALGLCVTSQEVEAPQSRLILNAERQKLNWPSSRIILYLTLTDQMDSRILDQRHILPHDMHEVFPSASLTGIYWLLDEYANPIRDPYARADVDAMIAQHGVDVDILIANVRSGYQNARAHATWIACRDDVLPRLDAAQIEQINASDLGPLFSDDPDWQFPDDCPDWAR